MGGPEKLGDLVHRLRGSPGVQDKRAIHRAYEFARASAGSIALGDDCAAIPDHDGFILLAAEGMLPAFVEMDPWFAGYCSVMVNLSDVAAMGGRSLGIVDVIWSGKQTNRVQEGMLAASAAYAVPIVGGHTTTTPNDQTRVAAAVVGRAKQLLTSFDAKPDQDLIVAVDLRGEYRGEFPFWNASTGAPPLRLRGDLEILPTLAEAGFSKAAKDISNGGIIGTLAMLTHSSGVAAELMIDRVPGPAGVSLSHWLTSFPSYGFLVSAEPPASQRIVHLFRERHLSAEIAGRFLAGTGICLCQGQERVQL